MPPPTRGKGGDERPVRAAVQRRGLVHAPALGRAAVAPAIGQVGAGFVHEHEARPIFRLHGLHKRAAQLYDPPGGVFGGVDAFFWRPQPTLSTARHTAVRLRAGPPAAAKAARTSSSVASGC